jgi:biofilm PGA synthesis N-glycosyltransferase PgaC
MGRKKGILRIDAGCAGRKNKIKFTVMITLFYAGIAIIFYTYIGYGLLLLLAVMVRRLFLKAGKTGAFTPTLTVIVTAYNEIACINEKIENTLALNYPAALKRIIFVTDGSDDGTPEAVARYPQLQLMHEPRRSGKIAAIHRAMQEVQTEIVVFTDANTMLNADALMHIGRHYHDERTGAVSGEKRVDISGVGDATAGEGFYWKYESLVKYLESEVYSVSGAAGELFSIRTRLYGSVPADTILDDLFLSMQIAIKGYQIKYEPNAYATEQTSASLTEERKRKIRIAAGDIQAMLRLPFITLLFTKPFLWFEYVSHRILRWIVTPYLLITVFALNILLAGNEGGYLMVSLYAQLFFYFFAFAGWLLRKQKMRSGIFFVPYYFCLMNYGLMAGLLRYVFKGQPVNWEKAVRR